MDVVQTNKELANRVRELESLEVEREQAKEALEKSQRLLAATERLGHVGGWEFNVDTFELLWTDEVYRIHELDLTYEPTVEKAISFYTPACRSIIEQAVQRTIEHGEPFDLELDITTAKGNLRVVHALGASDSEHRRVHGLFQDITERKQTEKERDRLKVILRTMIDSFPAWIACVDTDGNYLIANNYYTKTFQLPLTKIEGHNFKSFFPPDLYAKHKQLIAQTFAIGKTMQWEDQTIFNKDQITYIYGSYTPLYDNDGSLWGVSAFALDVSKIKQAEEAFRNVNDKFLSLADKIPGHIAYVNANTLQYEFVNETFEKSFGIPREKIIGSHVKEIIGQMNYEFALPYINEVRSGKSISYENTFDLASGTRWIEVNYTPVIDATGLVTSIAVLSYDITERKQAEETIKKSEEKFRSLFNNSEIAMFRTRLDGSEILDVNQKWLDLVGKTRDEAVGNPSVIVWEDPKEREKMVRRLIADGSVSDLEFNMLSEQKGVRNCVTSLRLYRDEGILEGSIADITERQQAEKERKRLQAQLNQAQKMEAIGILAGGIAHDFNNILAAIMGFTELARQDAPPASHFAKDLDHVLTATHRAKDLVKQILAFSRQSNTDRMPIKIQVLVKESLKLIRASLPSTIAIIEDINPQYSTILADPTQIHQVVMNLCTNAFHAMEKTGGELSVTLKTIVIEHSAPIIESQKISPGEYVELTVSDTGTGIDPDIIGKIFDPFFTTKEIGKGTGMGLSILHGIITGSGGGAITVESTIGQGTTFHVYFPVVHETTKESEESADSQEVPRGKGRILFVDDEELLLELGKDMLERLGYTVTTRSRSIEALEAFMNAPAQFDLVVTDQTMPGMTGIDLSRRMLQIRPDIPIILCTGYSNLVSEESAKVFGIREFALKPLTLSSIGHLLKKLLGDNGEAVS